MVLDGQGYLDADFGYPNLYHPKAPLIGPALGKVLRIAYFIPRNQGRKIFDQNDAINFRDLAGSTARRYNSTGAYVRIAEGLRYIPDLTTHIVAEARFSIPAPDIVRVFHRLSISDGTDTDEGDEVLREIGQDTPETPRSLMGFFSPFAASRTFVARCEVALSDVTAGVRREVFMEAYAKKKSNSDPVPYMRHHVGGWLEIRES